MKFFKNLDQKKLKKIVFSLAIAQFAIIFAFSAFQLVRIQWGYAQGQNEYDEITRIARGEGPEGGADIPDENDYEPTEKLPNLSEINHEYTGWIEIPGTKVNYPVVHGGDNEKYLQRTFEGSVNSVGAIFMDYRNTGDFTSRHTIIYGHNVKNGTMFGSLSSYLSPSFINDNPYIYIYTETETLRFRVFSAQIVSMYDMSVYQHNFASGEEFNEFLKHVKAPSGADQILSLSTCTNNSQEERLLVQAVLETREQGGLFRQTAAIGQPGLRRLAAAAEFGDALLPKRGLFSLYSQSK